MLGDGWVEMVPLQGKEEEEEEQRGEGRGREEEEGKEEQDEGERDPVEDARRGGDRHAWDCICRACTVVLRH